MISDPGEVPGRYGRPERQKDGAAADQKGITAMMKSLYSGVAGMKTHNQRMDVIGNNISNVNTTGYKASAVTFKDVYYQTKTNASAGDATTGGKNPTQIGYGAQLGSVQQIMTQSGFTYTDSYYDCALEGEGFFQVMDDSGNIYYTRSGKFSVDSYGNLCDQNGNMVLGVSGDPTGVETGQSQRINIRIPAVEDNKASSTKNVNGYDITITAASPGEEGNISFSIVNSDTPFATKSGPNLTIYMDLDQDFGGEALKDYNKTVIDLYTDYVDPTATEPKDAEAAAIILNLREKYGNTRPDGAPDTDPLPWETDPEYYAEAYRRLEGKINELSAEDRTFAAEISNARNIYTQAALDDFETKLNDAIKQGGVDLSEDILPLDVSFDNLPSYSDVQALNATNTLDLYTYDADGSVADKISLTFTADTPGEFANKYEIDLKYSSSIGSAPVAKWKDSTLTITVPESTTLEAIQKAVNLAAADKGEDYKITVSAAETTHKVTTTDDSGNTTESEVAESAYIPNFSFSTALGAKTERLGLAGGRDNFFSDIATAMSTVTLTDGRLAAEQEVDDLESLRIQNDGTIIGRHAVHGLLYLGRIDIATFENPTGLEQAGTTLWRATLASGEAQVKIAGKDGAGDVVAGALEMSNVDLAQEFSDMIITQRGYQANSRIITVSDTMLEELINLKR